MTFLIKYYRKGRYFNIVGDYMTKVSLQKVIAALFFLALPGLAESAIKVSPVLSIGYINSSAIVSYSLPCGAKYLGTVVLQEREELALGVAYKVKSTQCVMSPTIQTERLKWLSHAYNKKLIPLAKMPLKGRWYYKPINKLQSTAKLKGDDLNIVHLSSCRNNTLPLIHSKNNSTEVGIIEYKSSPRERGVCPPTEKLVVFKNILTKKHPPLKAVTPKTTDLKKSFVIQIAPPNKGSVKRSSKGIYLSYKRHCDEAPIGIVTSDIKNKNNQKRVAVGVVLARYYNLNCRKDTPHTTQETLINSQIKINRSIKLVAFKKSLKNLNIRTPKIIINKRKVTSLDYYSSCTYQLGAVYGIDLKGNLSIGVLEKPSNHSCKKTMKRVSLRQPFFSAFKQKESKAFPMRVKGLTQT